MITVKQLIEQLQQIEDQDQDVAFQYYLWEHLKDDTEYFSLEFSCTEDPEDIMINVHDYLTMCVFQ